MSSGAVICVEPRGFMSARHFEPGQIWAVALAGGEGGRLRSLTRQLYGEERPKQYAAFTGRKTLLRQTMERIGSLAAGPRTVVVTQANHARYFEPELAGFPEVRVLDQPCDRGTAAGILLPAHWIFARDPHATIVVFPTDHFIVEETLFMQHVKHVAGFVQAHPEWLVLLGTLPEEPEVDYGWIQPGEYLGAVAGEPVNQVRDFCEKPIEEFARHLMRVDGLWNTFVFAASASALIDIGRRYLPLLHDRLVRLGVYAGTQYESWAMRQAYLFAPKTDFSRAVLASRSSRLAVSQLPPVGWCDLGTPERIARCFGQPHGTSRVTR